YSLSSTRSTSTSPFTTALYTLSLHDALPIFKAKLDGKIGEPLTITSRLGRKKSKTRHGVFRETFPSVFIIELNHDENAVERVSYSYTDILTKNIELNFG